MGGGIQSAPRPPAAGRRRATTSRPRPQPLDLRRGQPPMPARREHPEPQRPEGDPLERLDAVPDHLAHAPYLALAALVDGELELARPDPPYLRRRGPAVLELDALAEAAQGRLADGRVADHGAVGLGHLE